MITLHTLGDSLIEVGEKEVRPASPLVFAALLYLGIERGHRVSRAALQELLFPKSDERSGAHSLRQLLYKLRQLGAPIESDSGSVWIKEGDVRDVASELKAADAQARAGKLDFLPGYEPKLSELFDEWLDDRRAAATGTVRRELLVAMARNRERLNWASVEQLARRVLEIDPLNEEATLALAEATALSGGKAEAVRMLTRYEEETGRADLRLAPSILRRRISESAPDTGRSIRTPFVGRESDAEAVHQQIQRARKGEPSVLVLAGEAGIGKTRLLEEACALAALEGMLVLTVRCQAHYASRPLGVFIELVPALLSARGALGVSPQSLAFLNLLTSHDDNRADRPSDARDDVSRSTGLVAALRDLVDAVSAETPLLIAIEDAHWADRDSLVELTSLVRNAAQRSLMIMYTTRFADTLGKATATGDEVIHRLKVLDEPSMVDLARRVLPPASDAALISWCARTAAGNPFYLQMLCAHYAQTRQAFTVPPSLIAATTRRIEHLPLTRRRVLEFVALLGRHCTVESLRALTECTHLELLNAVQELEQAGHLQASADCICVSHDLLTECTLKLVPPAARLVLHSCVARNLEERYEVTRDAAILWDCAEQWVSSGETSKAVEFLKRCARHASRIGKSAQALTILQRAKQLSRFPDELSGILEELMVTAKAVSQWADVYEYWQQLQRLQAARPVGHNDYELLGAEALWSVKLSSEGLHALAACAYDANANRRHRIDAAFLLIKIAHETGQSPLAVTAFGEIEPLLDPSSHHHSDRLLPIVFHTSFGSREEALHLARKLRTELHAFESVDDRIRAANNLATALMVLGRLDEAIELCEEYFAITEALGLKVKQAFFCSLAAAIYLCVEDFGGAQRWHDRIDPSLEASISTILGRTHFMNDLELALWRSDTVRAQQRLDLLAKIGVGDTIRGKACLRGEEIRLKQLDASFQCDDSTLSELRGLYDAAKGSMTADAITIALAVALRRRGLLTELRDLLDDYLHHARRDLTEPPPTLRKLWDEVNNISVVA